MLFNRAGVKPTAGDGTELNELLLEFRGPKKKQTPSNTQGLMGRMREKEGTPETTPCTSAMPEVNPHCSRWLFDRTLLQFGSPFINKVSFFPHLSTSWTRASYKPHRRANGRHGVPRLNVTEEGPSKIHQGLSQTQRLKSPTMKAVETCPVSRRGRTPFSV